jgi:predicted metal-dependent peptidase
MTDNITLERVLKARTELLQTSTFYGVALSHVEPVISKRVPTAATDGAKHYWNPDFVAKLSQKHLLTVQKHENEHDVRRHHSRRGGRDPEEWNISTDLAINIDLVDAGDELPPGALLDPKYRGWSAEDIYRARELDRAAAEKQRRQEQAEQQQGADDKDDDADASQGGAGDESESDGDEGQDERDEDGQGAGSDADDEEPGDEAGDQGDGDGETGADQDSPDVAKLGDGEPSDQGDEADGAEGEGDAQAEGAGEGQDASNGDGTGEGSAAGGNASQGQPEADGDAEGGGQLPGSDDPGGMGAVLDAAETPADMSGADSKWERVLRQAASLAAKRGDAPGHLTREIERADHPPADWRDTLRQWFDQGATTVESWARPNRRFIGGGLYLPGRQRDGINRAVFLIDTSGSMDDVALACIAVETQAALDENILNEVIVVYGDTRVTRVDTYQNGDQIEFDPRGGGGTVLAPLFAHVRDEVESPSLIVAFTDGFIDDVASHGEPTCPVLWAYTGYPDAVKRHMANTPWGAPAIDVGTH